jgi:RNA polymerase-binding transcription factor DksA
MATKKTATAKKKAAPAKKTAAAKKKAAPAKKTASAKKTAAAKKKTPAKRARTRRVAGIVIPARIAATGEPYPFSVEFLKQQKAALINERARYNRHADHLEREAASLAEDREGGDVQFDEESGEGDSIAVERERDLALSAQAREAIDEIDSALERLGAGTYGVCVRSGLPIPEERLEAIPEASMRVEFKSRRSIWS